MVLADFVPETPMPVAPLLAVVAGFGLMFSQRKVREARVLLQRAFEAVGTTSSTSERPAMRSSTVQIRRDLASAPHPTRLSGQPERVDA